MQFQEKLEKLELQVSQFFFYYIIIVVVLVIIIVRVLNEYASKWRNLGSGWRKDHKHEMCVLLDRSGGLLLWEI